MPETAGLLLGPLLRHVDDTSAVVWMELDRRCTVTVEAAGQAHTAPTFTVHGHHYAVVDVTDLEPGGSIPYSVSVDGTTLWPLPDSPHPPSRIRPVDVGAPLRVAFGSCRTSAPHDAESNRTNGPDVLRALARRAAQIDDAEWPHLLLLLGDQVYADETSEAMREYIAARRDVDQPPGTELLDFDEYAYLYRLAWTDPDCRWLLSTLPSAMIFDDHDIRDDWNTSSTWRTQMQRTSWWQRRIVAGLASYWIYQHVGNLSPTEREADPVWSKVIAAGRDGDAGDILDALATQADADPDHYRWSYHRDIGSTRLVMVDSRAARVLDETDRRMLDKDERRWFADLLTGDVDHLLIGTSLPFLLEPGLHHFEAWSEAVVGGEWGPRAARTAERIRQAVDLEHWAAFQHSFREVARRVVEVATGHHGAAPATVMFLSGDVHHSYVADVELDDPDASRVLQAVCSPIRNPLPRWARWGSAVSIHGLAGPMGWLATRAANVPEPPIRWSVTEGPWFHNAIAFLDIDGRRAHLRWHTAELNGGDPSLQGLDPIRVT
jgi:PhoD-like phosphatase